MSNATKTCECKLNIERTLSYIDGYLFAAQLVVAVLVDQLEHVRLGRLRVADVDQLHLEHQRGAAGDHLAGAAVAVAQLRRDRQLALLA